MLTIVQTIFKSEKNVTQIFYHFLNTSLYSYLPQLHLLHLLISEFSITVIKPRPENNLSAPGRPHRSMSNAKTNQDIDERDVPTFDLSWDYGYNDEFRVAPQNNVIPIGKITLNQSQAKNKSIHHFQFTTEKTESSQRNLNIMVPNTMSELLATNI